MSANAGTPNLDAALDAGAAVVAEAAASSVAVPEVLDTDAMTDMEILNQEDAPVVEKTEPSAAAEPGEEVKTPEQLKAESDAVEAAKTPEQREADAKTERERVAAAEAEMSPADKALRDLKTEIDGNAELKAAFDKNPALASKMWRNARLAQDAVQFRETFATPAMAVRARRDAEDFHGLRSNYFSGKKEGYGGVLRTLWEADVVRDAKGQPVKDANGQFQTKGNWDNLMHVYRVTELYPSILKVAKGSEHEAEVTEAVNTLRNFIGEADGEPMPVKKGAASVTSDDSRLTPEERARLAKLDTLESQEGQRAREVQETYNRSVVEAVDTAATDFLTKRAKAMAPALSENLQKRAASDAWKEILELATQDPLLGPYKDSVLSHGGDEGKKKWAAECVKYAEARYRPILEKHIQELGAPVVQGNADTRKKLDAQKARTEVKGAAGAVTSRPAEDLGTQLKEGDELCRKLHNRPLTNYEVLDIDDLLPTMRAEFARRGGK